MILESAVWKWSQVTFLTVRKFTILSDLHCAPWTCLLSCVLVSPVNAVKQAIFTKYQL